MQRVCTTDRIAGAITARFIYAGLRIRAGTGSLVITGTVVIRHFESGESAPQGAKPSFQISKR